MRIDKNYGNGIPPGMQHVPAGPYPQHMAPHPDPDTDPEPDPLREQASKVLAGVHLAAMGHPYPFWPRPDQHRLYDTVRELGHQLADALFGTEWLRIDCATLTESPVARPKLVGDLRGGRPLVTQTDRISKLPHTGRRIDRYLIADLRMLAWEARKGVTRTCPQCHQTHQLKLATLQGARTHQIPSHPASKTPSPKVYPEVEEAAFAEILGPLDQGLQAIDQLWIGLPPAREIHYRRTHAGNEPVLTYLELITTRKNLIIQDDPQEPAGYRQTSIPFPARPADLPDTTRLREHQPGCKPPGSPRHGIDLREDGARTEGAAHDEQ